MFSFFKKKKFCPVCAKKLIADANFCDSCGYNFDTTSHSTVSDAPAPPQNTPPRFYYTYNGKKYDLTVAILLIKQGAYMQGIKSVRETTTLGLAEAKAIADDIKAKLDSGYVFDTAAPQTAPAKINPNRFYYTYKGKTHDLTDALDLTKKGEIIRGVKSIIEVTGLGLAESKLISDDLRQKIQQGEI